MQATRPHTDAQDGRLRKSFDALEVLLDLGREASPVRVQAAQHAVQPGKDKGLCRGPEQRDARIGPAVKILRLLQLLGENRAVQPIRRCQHIKLGVLSIGQRQERRGGRLNTDMHQTLEMRDDSGVACANAAGHQCASPGNHPARHPPTHPLQERNGVAHPNDIRVCPEHGKSVADGCQDTFDLVHELRGVGQSGQSC